MVGIGDAVTVYKTIYSGEADFEHIERVAMFRGHKPTFDSLVTEAKLTQHNYSCETMRANGQCYLVSGGFDFITGPVAAMCGFHDYHANHMNVDNGRILGTVKLPVLDREAKASYLKHYCKVEDIDISEAATIGDGANDLAMLQAAGMGVAFRGTKLLRNTIATQLNYTDLRGLLYLKVINGAILHLASQHQGIVQGRKRLVLFMMDSPSY